VGSSSPYMAVHARTGARRADVDAALADGSLVEMDAVRGCNYLVPKEQSWIAARLGTGRSKADLARAVKAGATEREVKQLAEEVLRHLAAGPASPRDLRGALGGRVRPLGEAGKAQGVSSTLPVAIALLLDEGLVQRKPSDGRIDRERYDYALAVPPRLEGAPGREEAAQEFARLYFAWAGASTLASFRWFAGLGAKEATEATQGLGLTQLWEGDPAWYATPEAAARFAAFDAPEEPRISLLGSLDPLLHLRREAGHTMDTAGAAEALRLGSLAPSGGLTGWEDHVVCDRGTVVGAWAYDPEGDEVVHRSWAGDPGLVQEAAARASAFIREDLGDFRSYALDSPQSRQPRLVALRAG
jgi:hypothetical protein